MDSAVDCAFDEVPERLFVDRLVRGVERGGNG